MSDKFLNRSDAPFSEKVWAAIDATVTGAAKSQLAGRRLLYLDGPYGLGLKAIPAADKAVEEKAEGGNVTMSLSASVPLLAIQGGFHLATRDIAAFEQTGLSLDLGAAAAAAIACARQEDAVVFNGSKAAGVDGLLNAKGAQASKLKPWTEVGAAAQDIIEAVTRLDAAGFHGPYALALAPERYNLLYRLYAQGNTAELAHVQTIVTDGVVKAQAIKAGGVLLATGKQYASIALGQDLMAGLVGPEWAGYEFTVMESLTVRILEPAAICVLK